VQVIVIEIAQINAVEVHSARERIVEPLDHVRDRRLATACTQTLFCVVCVVCAVLVVSRVYDQNEYGIGAMKAGYVPDGPTSATIWPGKSLSDTPWSTMTSFREG
jgi:hypothetical protein